MVISDGTDPVYTLVLLGEAIRYNQTNELTNEEKFVFFCYEDFDKDIELLVPKVRHNLEGMVDRLQNV